MRRRVLAILAIIGVPFVLFCLVVCCVGRKEVPDSIDGLVMISDEISTPFILETTTPNDKDRPLAGAIVQVFYDSMHMREIEETRATCDAKGHYRIEFTQEVSSKLRGDIFYMTVKYRDKVLMKKEMRVGRFAAYQTNTILIPSQLIAGL